jgi:orotate phosphoribosyltransferase
MNKNYKQQFITIAIQSKALCFGSFTLKSGRQSPYFFNAGLFNNALALSCVGSCYAAAIQEHFPDIDLLFGPAYKGIPLVSATAQALHLNYQRNINIAFNRKEKKQHGEGGHLMGAPITGNTLIIDDVITAGTAVREVLTLLSDEPAHIQGLLIGLDRQEKNNDGISAVTALERSESLTVKSIIGAHDLLPYLKDQKDLKNLKRMEEYLNQFGC